MLPPDGCRLEAGLYSPASNKTAAAFAGSGAIGQITPKGVLTVRQQEIQVGRAGVPVSEKRLTDHDIAIRPVSLAGWPSLEAMR
jgi:hypothetical protein